MQKKKPGELCEEARKIAEFIKASEDQKEFQSVGYPSEHPSVKLGSDLFGDIRPEDAGWLIDKFNMHVDSSSVDYGDFFKRIH